jgi:hypothetical protein
MDLALFLGAQPWLAATWSGSGGGGGEAGAAGARASKRRALAAADCAALAHLSFAEQYGSGGGGRSGGGIGTPGGAEAAAPRPRRLAGAKAPDAVFLRFAPAAPAAGPAAGVEFPVRAQVLQLQGPPLADERGAAGAGSPGGGAEGAAAAGGQAPAPALAFCLSVAGRQHYLDPSAVRAVVASRGVYRRAAEGGSGGSGAPPGLMLSSADEEAAGQEQQQQQQAPKRPPPEFVTVVTPHVCLDLFVRPTGAPGDEAVLEGLAAFAAALAVAAAAAAPSCAPAAAGPSPRAAGVSAPRQRSGSVDGDGGGVGSTGGAAADAQALKAELAWVRQAAAAGELTRTLCRAPEPGPPPQHLLQALVGGHGRRGRARRPALQPALSSCLQASSSCAPTHPASPALHTQGHLHVHLRSAQPA